MVTKYVIGIDFGGSKIHTAVIDSRGNVKRSILLPIKVEKGSKYIIKQIVRSIERIRKFFKKEEILGIGIGAPGPLDAKKGIIHLAPNLGWKNINLKKILEKETNLTTLLENDANLAALGEKWLGAGRKKENLICLTLGTGIGSGLILNGKLFQGENNFAGELGHLIVEKDGALCRCGKRGCVEAYSSASGMVKRAEKFIEQGEKTLLKKEGLTGKKIYQAAKRGDRLALKIFKEAGEYLGLVLANVVNLLNINTIIIGGNVSKAGKLIFSPLRRELKSKILPVLKGKVKVKKAHLGGNAGLLGAGKLIWDYLEKTQKL